MAWGWALLSLFGPFWAFGEGLGCLGLAGPLVMRDDFIPICSVMYMSWYLLMTRISSGVTSGSVCDRNSSHLENAMKTSIASTTLAFLSSFSMTADSLASLSLSPAMSCGSLDELTCVMSVSMVSRSLLTSSGRVMFLAARASFHPSAVDHLDMVTRETSTLSAISCCSIPER